MAKKQQDRRNSRAARRSVPEPTIDTEDSIHELQREGGKTEIMRKLAEKELREHKPGSAIPAGMDELTAISRGLHPGLQKTGSSPGRVAKQSSKKNKRAQKKRERALMVKDQLNEKIDLAKQRHKVVKTYRKPEDEDEEGEK